MPVSLDHNDPDEDADLEPNGDDVFFYRTDWPLSALLGDAVRVGVAVFAVYGVGRIVWALVHFAFPS
jgi:hypothetical protein